MRGAVREGVSCATLIPHVYPHGEPDFPIYSLGARMPRTGAGRWMWRHAQGPVRRGLELGRRELNNTRARLGLPPLAHVHGGISRQLALVATFPQLEYPRTNSTPSWPVWKVNPGFVMRHGMSARSNDRVAGTASKRHDCK